MKKIICLFMFTFLISVPAVADEYLDAARKQLAEENYSKALNYTEKSLDENPDNIEATFLLADIYCAKEKYKTAIEIYNKVLKKNRNNIEALNRLGHVYYSGEYYKDAISIFEEVLANQPENVKALYMMGMCHALAMDLDKGYTIYRRLKKKNEKLAKKLLHQLQGHLT